MQHVDDIGVGGALGLLKKGCANQDDGRDGRDGTETDDAVTHNGSPKIFRAARDGCVEVANGSVLKGLRRSLSQRLQEFFIRFGFHG